MSLSASSAMTDAGWADDDAAIAIVTPHPARPFVLEPEVRRASSPLESAARALKAAGRAVQAFTLDAEHGGGLVRHRGFDGDVGALITALRGELEEGRVGRVLAGPAGEPLARAAVALTPERSCLWCGLSSKPSPKDAAMAGAIRQAHSLLFSSDAEKRLIVEAFGASLSRAKIEAPSLYGVAPRSYRVAEPPPQGAHPYLAHFGALGRAPLRDWFIELRDAFAFTHGPIDLYVFGAAGSEDGGVGVRSVSPMAPEAESQLIAEALAVVEFSPGPEALTAVFDAWRLGAPVIVSPTNHPARAEVTETGGGFVVDDANGLRVAVEQLQDPATRHRIARAGRERAARRTDPDRFAAGFLPLLGL